MSTWQELLKQRSITSIEALAERFGEEHFPDPHGDRQLRVPDLAADGGPDQVPRRPDLAPVHPDHPGARGGGRDRGFARGGPRQPGPQHHPPLPRPGALPGFAGLRQLLPLLHPASQGGRPGKDPDVPVRVRLPVPGGTHRDPGRHHVGGRPSHALRPAARGHPRPAPEHQAYRDHPDREPGAVPPAGADHPGALRHAPEIPPALHQHPFQPPRRAHAGGRGRPRHAGGRRDTAGVPDGAPQGHQRHPRGDGAADAAPPDGAGPPLLHLHGGPGGGRGALPHHRRDRPQDHEGAPRVDQRPRQSPLRDRRPGRRREGPAPAGVRRELQRGRGGVPELPGRALRLPAAQGSRGAAEADVGPRVSLPAVARDTGPRQAEGGEAEGGGGTPRRSSRSESPWRRAPPGEGAPQNVPETISTAVALFTSTFMPVTDAGAVPPSSDSSLRRAPPSLLTVPVPITPPPSRNVPLVPARELIPCTRISSSAPSDPPDSSDPSDAAGASPSPSFSPSPVSNFARPVAPGKSVEAPGVIFSSLPAGLGCAAVVVESADFVVPPFLSEALGEVGLLPHAVTISAMAAAERMGVIRDMEDLMAAG